MNEQTFSLSDIWRRGFSLCNYLITLGALTGLFFVAFEPSLGSNATYQNFANSSDSFFYYIYFLHLLLGLLYAGRLSSFFKHHFFDIVFFAPLLFINFKEVHSAHILLIKQGLHFFSTHLGHYTLGHFADSIARKPSRLVLSSFFGVIILGTFILVLPISVAPGHEPSLLTALFTSTSAVCVTGLIVVDTPVYFSTFGQIGILMLIQIGGLGLMTLSAGISLIAGKKMAMSQTSMMQEMLDLSDVSSLKSALKSIFLWSFLIEAIGAVILSTRFYILTKCCLADAVFTGIFHSISAFCNAGFSTFSDSLMGFNGDPVINFTIMGLIVTGGLGFVVLSSISVFLRGARNQRMNTHAYMVLTVSILLIFAGTLIIFVLEADSPVMSNLSISEKIMAALFQSVSTRTAGFNTIDFSSLKTSTLFFMSMLMFIGASPGSTGGGIKTTTFATLILFMRTKLRGETQVSLRGRGIADETILKAFLIVAISAILIFTFVFLLILTENHDLIKIIFEAFSAFATVGLSTGITSALTTSGKLLIIVLMFIGRTGPLTMALSITAQGIRSGIRYPDTRILVG
ncbi:MAG: Trk family potassium uptake protein [Erysipelotrichia bacterium]|nr:Trk family potassium uptake protein [Erysipelotrichia bacterium]